jgi:two-component system, OmpR family, sensor histidine kinase KdpD
MSDQPSNARPGPLADSAQQPQSNEILEEPSGAARRSRVRLLVALGGGREDAALVRAAHRLAEREGVGWRAVHVDSGRDDHERRMRLEQLFALVHRLGGETQMLQGRERAEELLDHARELRVKTLVVGRARPSGWRFWRRPVAEHLLRKGGAFDLVVVAEAGPKPRFRPRRIRQPVRLREPAVAVLSPLVALGAAWGLEPWLELANLSLLFLVAVLASAALAGTRAAMLSAGLGFLAFNVFFTQPRLSLAMVEHDQLITVIVFLLVAVVVGQLAGIGRRRLMALRNSREQTYRLLSFSRALSAATGRDQVRDIGVSTLEQWLGVPVTFLEREGDTDLVVRAAVPAATTPEPQARAAADWCWQHRQPSGHGTETMPELRWRFIPLVGASRVLGVVGLELAVREGPLDPDQEALIDTVIRQLVMALACTRH